MIINVIGPIAVGKSLFCKKFTEKYPEFVHVAIDDCRRAAWRELGGGKLDKMSTLNKLNLEELAWQKLWDGCKNNDYVILETSGLSWRIKDVLHYDEFVKRGIYTIKLVGSIAKCLKRLRNRKKAVTPFIYEFDQEEGLRYLFKNIHRAPHNLLVNVDTGLEYNVLFDRIVKRIDKARLRYEVRGKGNNCLKKNERRESEMKVTDAKFFAVKGAGKVKAFAAITFNGELTVRGYKVIEGKDGLFVGKPSQLNEKDQKWYDNVNYVSQELQSELHADILRRYRESNTRSSRKEENFSQVESGDEIPF